MRAFSRRLGLIAAMLNWALFASAFALPQQSKEAKEPAGSITGRVTVEGKPAPNIAVMLLPTDTGPLRQPAAKVTTDEEGRFQFTRVGAGSYNVQPHAPMFILPNEGMRGQPGKNVTLADGESADGINIPLRRGGVITGRITDVNGRPLAEERVVLIRIDERGQKQPASLPVQFLMSTDDRGIYRLYGVPPGRYIIGVGRKPEDSSVRVGVGNAFYTRTYHPNTTDESSAAILEVTAGSETTGADIIVSRPSKTYSATGRIIAADTGKPLADISYGFGKPSPDGKYIDSYVMAHARSTLKGEFRVEGLSPGKYVVITTSMGGQTPFYGEAAIFDVVDSDVSGLEIKVHRGSTISGVVLLEDAANEEALAKFSQLHIGLNLEPQQLISPRAEFVKLGLDGSFTIIGLPPGKARFLLSTLKEFRIKRIERDGVEQPGEIEIGAGERISGVKVLLSYGNGSIRGQIKVEGGTMPEGARLMIMNYRKDENAPTPTMPVQPDVRGRFVIEGLTPGEYEVMIPDSIPVPGRPPIRIKPVKQIVTVNAGEESQVTLTINLNAKDDSKQ